MLLILYYVVMILLDIRKANAMKAAELEKNSEEEIDISDEADTFKPVLITREDPNKVPATDTEKLSDTSEEESRIDDNRIESGDKESNSDTDTQDEISGGNPEPKYNPLGTENITGYNQPEKTDNKPSDFSADSDSETKADEKPFRRDGYREALMTDGLEVERFLEEAELLASTGKCSLGDVVYEIHDA